MQSQYAAAQTLVLERLAQNPGARYRSPVVGEAERPLPHQLGHLGQLHALQAARDRRQKTNRDARLAGRRLAQRAQQGCRVEHGVGVGHCDHRTEAAGRRGPGARLQILLVLLAGTAQMHVGVHKGRQQVLALALNDFGSLGLQAAGCAQLGDVTVAHEYVGRAVQACARIEHMSACDQ